MGTQLPPRKRGEPPPKFLAHFYCGQTAGCIKMPLGMEVGLSPGDFVLDGDPVPPSQKRGRSPPPQFSAHVYCGQIAGWIKMALGVEVCLRRGHIVLDGDPAPLPTKKGKSPSIFGPFLLWPKGWMHQNATWYGRRPKPRRHCVRWGPSCPSPKRGRSPPPLFSALVYCGQTVAQLSNC